MLTLLAQVSEVTPVPTRIDIAFIVVCLSLVALIGWLMKHVFMTTVPSLQAENKNQREHHEKVIAEICAAFRQANEEERKLCAGQFTLVNTALAALSTGLTQLKDTIIASVGEHITSAMAAYRHETNDILQQAVMGKELFMERKKREALEDGHRRDREQGQRRGLTEGES